MIPGAVVAVVAHVKRRARLADLVDATGADAVFEDDGTLGEWANHERALRWAHAEAAEKNLSHVLIVQDDAVPVEMFRTQVAGLIAVRPDDMIGLYVGTYRPHSHAVAAACDEADRKDAMFLSGLELFWGVATLMPARHIPAMLEVAAKSKRPYDTRLGRAWTRVTGALGEEKPVIYCWPSLVDHRDERSVIAGRTQTQGVRVARRTGWLTGDAGLVVPIDSGPRRMSHKMRKNLSS